MEAHDGFFDLQVWRSDRDPDEVPMVTRWRDRDAFTAYMKSADHRTSHERMDARSSGPSPWSASSNCTPISWLARVLESRGFPLERLARSLEIGADVVRDQVGGAGEDLAQMLGDNAGYVRSRSTFLTL